MNLQNPYGKATCLLLNVFTMEFGDPPLYSVINSACRDLNKVYMGTLGPFIACLGAVTEWAEQRREDEDKIHPGKNFGGDEWNIAGIFLVFKGGKLEEDWIEQWKQSIDI